MKSDIFSFLRKYSTDPQLIDRLIVSSFLQFNKLSSVTNDLINTYVISKDDGEEYRSLIDFNKIISENTEKFNYENLMELFEFVISPSEKIVNGAVYTPDFIREYIVDNCFERLKVNLNEAKCGDLACGCGGFLLTIAIKIKNSTNKSYKQIFAENIYGLDIAEYSITRSKLLLTLFAISEGEDSVSFKFNIRQGNALAYDWQNEFFELKTNEGFDLIVGNPPYVTSRNMDEDTLLLLEKWAVSSTGHPDLYIPFFQLGLENLNSHGLLGFITVNTFFKSVNGRALRSYFSANQFDLKIIDFGGEQVFKSRSTYTCLCFIQRSENGCVSYFRANSKDLNLISNSDFSNINYDDLNDLDGWHLNTKNVISIINKLEKTGTPLGEIYNYRTGIATLRNNIYKFIPVEMDDEYYILEQDNIKYPIEKSVCREVINSNIVRSHEELKSLREKIIFPYEMIKGKAKVIKKEIFKSKYPQCYKYLSVNKSVLAKRDKGKREYEEWYAYGRSQSLEIGASYKLFFPHLCSSAYSVICDDKNLLYYNGEAILSESLNDLLLLKVIIESDLFWFYIVNSSKPYSSNFYSLGKNYIKNFGIADFTAEEIDFLINEPDRAKTNLVLHRKYNVQLPKNKPMTDFISGYVTEVLNGESFILNVNGRDSSNKFKYNNQETIFIPGIDTDRSDSLGYKNDTSLLISYLQGKEVECHIQKRDEQSRLIARVKVI